MNDAACRQKVKMSARNCSLEIVDRETVGKRFEIGTQDTITASHAVCVEAGTGAVHSNVKEGLARAILSRQNKECGQ
jgi:hypothetical protein